MAWGGEEQTARRVMPKGTILYHNSDTRIEKFVSFGIPESTCFFTDDRGNGRYRYQVKTGFTRKVSYYGEEEVRFDLRREDRIIEISTGRVVSVEDI